VSAGYCLLQFLSRLPFSATEALQVDWLATPSKLSDSGRVSSLWVGRRPMRNSEFPGQRGWHARLCIWRRQANAHIELRLASELRISTVKRASAY